MLTVTGATYKDVTKQDFNHYFANTAMAWKIGITKRRLFLVSSCDGATISGSYLTREKLFKDKTIPWDGWHDKLDPIVSQPLYFNFADGAGVWRHSLEKNLRKSFPWRTNCVSFYGNVTNKEKTLQELTAIAFSELYGNPKDFPSTASAILLQDGPKAVITREKFIVDKLRFGLFYHQRRIGLLVGGTKIQLFSKNEASFKPYLRKLGVPEEVFLAPVAELVLDAEQALNTMPHKDTYDPGAWPGFPGFCIVCTLQGHPKYGTYRTYKGMFPGNNKLPKGWVVYNYWNQNP